jgi:hypothetical protein
MAYVGLWFLLVKPVGDGSYQVEFMIKRLFLMMGLLMAVLSAPLPRIPSSWLSSTSC